MQRTIKEIRAVRDRCGDRIFEGKGSRYPGMSYEEGIEEVLSWLMGDQEQDEWPYVDEESDD